MASWQSRARNALKKSGYTLPEDKEYTAVGSDGKSYSVSYGLVKAVEGNGINSYSPKNDGEKRVLENYKRQQAAKEKTKKTENSTSFKFDNSKLSVFDAGSVGKSSSKTADTNKNNTEQTSTKKTAKTSFLSWLFSAAEKGGASYTNSLANTDRFLWKWLENIPILGKGLDVVYDAQEKAYNDLINDPNISDEVKSTVKNIGFSPEKRFTENASKNLERVTTEAQLKSTARGGGVWDVGTEVVSNVVRMLPSLVASYATAGGLAATAASLKSAGMSTAERVIATMAENPVFWVTFAETIGDEYADMESSLLEESKRKTGNENAKLTKNDERIALSTSLITALMNAGIEVGGVQELPQKLASSNKITAKKAIKEWVTSAIDEGKEEVVQGIISQGMQKLVSNNDNKIVSLTDDNAVISGKRAAQEFGMGALIGGIMGGAQIGVNSGMNALANAAYNRYADKGAANTLDTSQENNSPVNKNAVVMPESNDARENSTVPPVNNTVGAAENNPVVKTPIVNSTPVTATESTPVNLSENEELQNLQDTEAITQYSGENASEGLKRIENTLISQGVSDDVRQAVISVTSKAEQSLQNTGSSESIIKTAESVRSAAVSTVNNMRVNTNSTATPDDYNIVYAANMELVSAPEASVTAEYVDSVSSAFTNVLSRSSSGITEELANSGINPVTAFSDYVINGVVPGGITDRAIFTAAGEQLETEISEGINAMAALKERLYGTDAARTLKAQANMAESGDFSFLSNPVTNGMAEQSNIVQTVNATATENVQAEPENNIIDHAAEVEGMTLIDKKESGIYGGRKLITGVYQINSDKDFDRTSYKKEDFDILVQAKPWLRTLSGVTYGHYGYTKHDGGVYNLCHLPTGIRLGTVNSEREARRAVKALNDAKPDLGIRIESFGDGFRATGVTKALSDEIKEIINDSKADSSQNTVDVKLPLKNKKQLIEYLTSHVGDKIAVSYDGGRTEEIRTIVSATDRNIVTKRPDGQQTYLSAKASELSYTDNGFVFNSDGNTVSYRFITYSNETASEAAGSVTYTPETVTNTPETEQNAEKRNNTTKNMNNTPESVSETKTEPTSKNKPENDLTDADNSDIVEGEKDSGQATPVKAISDFVLDKLGKGESITANELRDAANEAYHGSMAEGTFTIKDVYDAMELGVNRYILSLDDVTVDKMLHILDSIPTQTKRTEAQLKYQQFSTPPSIAYLAEWTANVNSNDTVFEPSAGTGGIAVFAKHDGAKVYVNELDKRRLDILKNLPFDGFFNEDAEQINNILGSKIKPTVVVMNPPFTNSSERNVHGNKVGAKHIEQALKTLAPNGRLVAITGHGMADDAASFRSWWKDIKAKYNVVANIGINGKNYNKYGTSFDIQMLVIDNSGPTTSETITAKVDTLSELQDILGGIRNARPDVEYDGVSAERTGADSRGKRNRSSETRKNTAAKSRGENVSTQDVSDTGGGNIAEASGRGASDTVTDGERAERTDRRNEVDVNFGATDVDNEVSAADRGGKSVSGAGRETSGAVREADKDRKSSNGKENAENVNSERVAGDNNAKSDRAGTEKRGAGVRRSDDVRVKPKKKKTKVLTDSVYDDYEVQPLKVKNAQPHPTKVSESSAMASVSKPAITYKPHIAQELIDNGVVSDVQLESISYAGQNHEQRLENGKRKGFFIGDGTGLGKGRTVAGIILDNRNRGRKKAVWISERPNLYSDAQRDIGAVIGDETLVHQFEGGKKAEKSLSFDDGVLFAAYPTLSKGYDKPGSNYEKLVEWLGKDFDGVIAFDEAHNMANSGGSGARGKRSASSTYKMGKALDDAFPNARIVYLSATGATEVGNLKYAERLGLWGEGTAFSNADDFAEKISAGGVAAMELVASNMKENGVYLSRNISYDGVEYDRLTHKLSKKQTEIYGELARAWQLVLQNMNKALEVTNQKLDGMARGRQNSAFWSGQQRFFNQVLTAMQVPSVIKDIEKQLEQGRSAVIQLVTTNEAAQKRESARIADEGLDLEDFDLTPKQMLMSYVENVFPVEQYETYIDDEGNERVKPVFDSEGNPVLNADAVKQRDELLTKLGSLKVPSSPIDMIVEHFGSDLVAEVTGRSKRIIRKDGKMVEEQRSKSTNAADVDAFQNGNKRILIFSGAGATGKSYHADRNAKNQQQRVHYLLEAGWVANKAVQGFGRSHRSNQAVAPIFKLVTTDLKGQNRFISTIAKRLSQLGALTKGSAKAGNQGMFTADDDLEGPIASDTLANYYKDLIRNEVTGIKDGTRVIEKLGLKDYLLDRYGSFKESGDAWRDVKKFLNRILVLEPKEQNAVFDGFNERLRAANEIARQNGTLDRGLENYKADGLTVKESKVVHTDSSTGAETTYYNLEAKHKQKPLKINSLDTDSQSFMGFYRSNKNGKIRAMFRSSTTTDKDGNVVQNYKAYGPAGYEYMPESRVIRNWEKVKREEAEGLWSTELKSVPEYKTNPVHLMTGNLLSIWNKMPAENVRVYRMLTDDGNILLGRVIPDDRIDSTLRQLGSSRTKTKMPTADIIKAIQQGDTLLLENGWRISQRRVSGENRIEISGPTYYNMTGLERAGVFTERISYNTRFFVPTGSKAADVMDRIFKISPVDRLETEDNSYSVEVEDEEGNILSDGSGERQDGESTGFKDEGLAGRAESYKEGRKTANERRELGKTLKADGNTEQKVISGVRGDFIKPESYNDRMTAIAQENARRGLKTEFAVGNVTIAYTGGREARGVFDHKTNTAIIRYDHSDYTPEQINKHETIHAEYRTTKTQKAVNIIRNSLSVSERQSIIRSLAADYNGIVTNNEDAVFEEFIANTLAGMNDYTELYEPVVRAYWADDSKSLDAFDPAMYQKDADTGGNADILNNIGFGNGYSVENIDGTSKQYVKASRQIITGDNPTQWAKDVKRYIDTEIRHGRDVSVVAADGDILYITDDTSGKARFRNDIRDETGLTRPMNDIEYATKLRAEVHIDEIAQVSRRGSYTVPDKKNHSFAKDGFNYRTAYFEDFDGQYYKLTVSVGKNGEINTVYNVGKIKEAQFPRGSKASQKYSAVGTSASIDTIAQSSDIVKKFSLDTVENDIAEMTPKRRKEILATFDRDNMGAQKKTAVEAMKELKERIKNSAADVAHSAARVFPEIPERGERGTFFAEFRKNMVQFKALPTTASFVVQDKLTKMTDGLSPAEFKTFSQLVYFQDLQEEAQMQQRKGMSEILLPNNITPSEVNAVVAELQNKASDNVKAALGKRSQTWAELTDTYIRLNQYVGFDTSGRFDRRHYYRHQVIEYMNDEAKSIGSRKPEIKAGRGWLKERHGSTAPINTDFLAVEYKAMLQMQYDTYVADILSQTKQRYDIKPQLENEAFRTNKANLNKMIADEAQGRFNAKGEPDSETYRQQKWYNQRIMFGFSHLFSMAKAGTLPDMGEGYANVISALAHSKLNAPGLYKYVGEIAAIEDAQGDTALEDAITAARTVLKYTSQKKSWVKDILGKQYETWETLAKKREGYSIHQPRKGNYMYTKEQIDNTAFERAVSDMAIALANGEGIFTSDSVKDLFEKYSDTVRLIGAAYEQWVIPDEIVKTLDSVANPKKAGTASLIMRSALSSWKGWSTSVNPLRTVKFGLRNLWGDAEAVIAGQPKILAYSKRAVKEIYQAMHDKNYTPEMKEWIKRGGYSSMMFINEMDRATQEQLFGNIVKGVKNMTGIDVFKALKFPKKMFDGYYNAVQNIHDFRESILRYAAYLYFKDNINKNGGKVTDNVASNRFIMKGLESTEDKAYQLSKDLLGAYDEVSNIGQYLRQYLMPFFSFTETNFKRYYRMFANIIAGDGSIPQKAGKVILKALMINMLPLLMYAWNNFIKGDEEKLLPPSVRKIPHITFGRIGDNVYAFRQLGSFSELLEWVGLDDYELTKDDITAPIDKAWSMLTPFITNTFSLATGLNLYPDVSDPQVIRDKTTYIANSLGVQNVVDIVTGKPNKGWGDVAKGSLVYSYNIEESAYNEIISLKREYQGTDTGTIYKPTPKSNALYYMKKSIKYKDEEKALKYLDEYFEAGGTAKGIKQSLSMLNPMYGFLGEDTQEKGQAWIKSMSDDEREKLSIAQKYYENDLALDDDISSLLGKKDMTEEKAKTLLEKYIKHQCN